MPARCARPADEDSGNIDAQNVRRAHRLLEEGRPIGKLVLTGF
jgi:NADPH2:quinone reductase